jgi:hypothetical protein
MRRRSWGLFCAAISLSALAFFTTGCGSSSSGTRIRMVNAMPDEGSLDLLIDTKSAVTSVGYGAASSYISVSSGSRQLQVEATGTTTILIDRTDSISSGKSYSLASLNFSFNPSSILLTDDTTSPASGNFRLRVVNASPGMGPQDVYVVTDGTDITSVSPTFSGMGFGDSSSYTELTAGDYRVIFTVPNQKFSNLDSGKLTFASGQVRTVLGLNNPSGGFESTLLTDIN